MDLPSDLNNLDWPGLLLYLLGRKVPVEDALRYIVSICTLLEALRHLDNPARTAEVVSSYPKLFAVLGLIHVH